MQDDRDDQSEESGAEARAYLEQVLQELRAREARLAQIDQDLADLRFRLDQCAVERLVRAGDVRMVLAAESWRSKLRAELKRKQSERTEALEDVTRARERRQMAQEDLEDVEAEA